MDHPMGCPRYAVFKRSITLKICQVISTSLVLILYAKVYVLVEDLFMHVLCDNIVHISPVTRKHYLKTLLENTPTPPLSLVNLRTPLDTGGLPFFMLCQGN